MTPPKVEQLIEDIRDNQLKQLEYQAEALDIQRKQFELSKSIFQESSQAAEKAEHMLDGALTGYVKKFALLFLFVAILVVILLKW